MATVERREDIPSLPKLNENNNSKNSNSSDQKHTQLPGSTLSSPSHYSSSSNSSSNNSVSGNMFTSANSATTLSILATPDATFETRLRFWRYYPSSQRYVLSTCAESPHGISAVSAVKFHPKTELAVTCGMDKKFRVWALSESSASAPPLKEDEEGETGCKLWTPLFI